MAGQRAAQVAPPVGYSLATVAAVLAELMHNAESETVRVAAARTLLEKVMPMSETENSAAHIETRAEVLRAITELLDELAITRSATGLTIAGTESAAVKAQLDQERTAGAINPAGELENLDDHGRARLGENPHRG